MKRFFLTVDYYTIDLVENPVDEKKPPPHPPPPGGQNCKIWLGLIWAKVAKLTDL